MTHEELSKIKKIMVEIKILEKKMESIGIEVGSSTVVSVKGSLPVFPFIERTITMQGLDYTAYYNRIQKIKDSIKQRTDVLIDVVEKANKFIESIEDSEIRTILALRYIDGMSWKQVAAIIGEGYTPDSVRMKHNRFFENNKSVRSCSVFL